MSFRRSLERSKRLWEGFREIPARRARTIHMALPKTMAEMGIVTRIEYTTTHGRKAVLYGHDFAPGSRPKFCASPDGRIWFVGGRYRVTDRGIVDVDSRGRARRVRHR